jgi:putative inorganic carbon (hco3(-)) transporter
MRDIVLIAVAAALILRIFKTPEFGAYLWAWFSIMNPHTMTWGFARTLPFAQIIALLSILSLAMTRQRRGLPLNAITVLWGLLFFWMTVTSLFALNSTDLVLDRWVFVFKIQLMTLVSLMLIVNPRQLKILVAVVTLSIAYFGIKGGVFTLLTGGAHRVWGPPGGLITGNNEIAVCLVVVVPLLYWMREVAPKRWMRHAMTASIALCMVSIIGSQSRGAYLAIFVMAFFLGIKSTHPVRTSLVLMVLLACVVAFMPESWTNRMRTIGEYTEDTSAMSRLWTWQTLWNVAVDRPFLGAGFRADSRTIFAIYAPTGGPWEIFQGQTFVAHSIYFQMLGEHGFVGLSLFVALFSTVWITAGRNAQRARALPELADWLVLLMRMIQVSLIGYAVGGAFLSLAYLDVLYYLMGFVLLAGGIIERARAAPAELRGSQAGTVGLTTRSTA